jgi:hypothetical protein
VLKEFWFPFGLFLAALIPAFIGNQMGGNGRRIWFTITALVAFGSVLSFIWGDPVRGPFAYLTHPKNPEEFTFQAGISCHFPVKRLKDGIDFSRCMMFAPGSQPIHLWVKKTWWSDPEITLTLLGADQNPVLQVVDGNVQFIASGFDINHDDYALEFVGPSHAPLFQLIIEEDYGTIYINAIMDRNNGVTLLKDRKLALLNAQDAVKPENKLERLFKYPSYSHKGMRD